MKNRPLLLFCLILLLFRTGCTLIAERSAPFAPSSSGTDVPEEEACTLIGEVYQKEQSSDYQILYIKNISMIYQNKKIQKENRIVYDGHFTSLCIGNQVQISGTHMPFEEPGNPGQFDQRFYYRKQGIHGAVFAETITVLQGGGDSFREALFQLKEAWSRMLVSTLGEEDGGILSAILLGKKSGLPPDIKELYQKSGIGHILAISGLHISLLGMLVYKLLRKLGLPYSVSGLVSSAFLLCYVMMVGVGVSTLRALVMFLIRIGADMTGRVYDIKISLSVAAVCVIYWRPLYLFDAGFLLSFGAILGICVLAPVLQELFPVTFRFLEGVYGSVAIQFMLLPVMLFFYYELPLYSVLVNLLLLPSVSLLVTGGLLGSILFAIWGRAGALLLRGSHLLFGFYELCCAWSLKLPCARLITGQPKWYMVGVYYAVLFLFAALFYRKPEKNEKARKKWRAGTIFLFLFLSFWLLLPDNKGKDGMEVVMLDVGQGDGFYLRGPEGKQYFVDGGSSDVKSVGQYRIEPFLKSQGVGALDYVFLSHGDADHISGIQELIARQEVGVRIKNLVLPVQSVWDEHLTEISKEAEKAGIRVLVMKGGDVLSEGEMKLTCIQPSSGAAYGDSNAASLVFEVSYGEFDMLFTGDVEGEGEKTLIKHLKNKTYDVLKVAHHGSGNSSPEVFLSKTLPRAALISAGKGNRYGHPHTETLDRLRACKSRIYCTAEAGAVTVRSDGRDVWIRTYH